MTHPRSERHAHAKAFLRKAQWTGGLAAIKEIRRDLGDNLMLMIDQATCEWMLGQTHSLAETIATIEAALAQNESILSPNTLYNTRLFLGKYLEEQGRFKRALELYQSVVGDSRFEDRHKIMCEAQLLRAQCFLGLAREIETTYVSLSFRLKSHQSENQKAEVLHALMLADAELIGPSAALSRYDRAVSVEHSRSDAELLFYDLAEAFLLAGEVPPFETAPAPVGLFEETLACVLNGVALRYRDIVSGLDSLTLTTQVRTVALIARFGAEPVDQVRALKLLAILIRSFDSMSAKAMAARFAVGETSSIVLQNKDVVVGDQRLAWNRKSTALSVLEAFVSHDAYSVEALIDLVWKADFNPSYAERLRVLVHRINADLQSLAMKPQIIEIKDGHARLAKGLRIERHA